MTAPHRRAGQIDIANAGMVLFTPWLPKLFDRLGILTHGDDGTPAIAGIDAASRAVHVLQYLVDTRLDAPEPQLALNKLLCGLSVTCPVHPSISLDPDSREICDDLSRAMIANWRAIANSSTEALRESFLQRAGRLVHQDACWQLVVQRKSLDVLVDQIPWSIAMIFHRWMREPLHVTW